MTALLLIPEGADFDFSQSPFHVKGVLYQATQTFFDKKVPGGMKTLTDLIGPGELTEFITQTFLSSARYDVMPSLPLIEYEARALGVSVPSYLKARTQWQAEQNVHGIYRFLLRLTSPEQVISRLPKLLIQMFDFPQANVEIVGPTERIANFMSIPDVLQPWFYTSFSVYINTILKLAGAETVEVSYEPSIPMGERAGLTFSTMKMRVRWS